MLKRMAGKWHTLDRSLDRIRRESLRAQASLIRQSWTVAAPNVVHAVLAITQELRTVEELLREADADPDAFVS